MSCVRGCVCAEPLGSEMVIGSVGAEICSVLKVGAAGVMSLVLVRGRKTRGVRWDICPLMCSLALSPSV